MNFAHARTEMVERQLRARGISNERVLDAMGEIPREAFVKGELRPRAYEDQPLPIGFDQTISQPYTVALMSELLDLRGQEKVLEVGTGSGYQTTLLSRLAREVVTIERYAPLSEQAAEILQGLGAGNVRFRIGDGSQGAPEDAPFDAIVVTAAAPHIPEPLERQLAEGGRLVIPVGEAADQKLLRVVRRGGALESDSLGPFRFVPLVGKYGWKS